MNTYQSPFWFQQFRDSSGKPLANGKLYTFVTESSIPKPLYYDFFHQNPCPNPLPLDDSGFLPQFYLEDGLYTFILKSNNDETIATRDNIQGVLGVSSFVADLTNYFLPLSGGNVTGNISANSFIKLGGTSNQFLKADGSVDSTQYLPLSGGTLTGDLYFDFDEENSKNIKIEKNNLSFRNRPSGTYINQFFDTTNEDYPTLKITSTDLDSPVSMSVEKNISAANFYGLSLVNSKVIVSDPSAKLKESTIKTTELDHLTGVSANIQSQINALKQNSISGAGSGTINRITKFITTSSVGDSNISDNGTIITLNSNTAGSGYISANSFIKSSGTSNQFLKADGSVDSTQYLPVSGGTLTGTLTLLSGQNGLVSTNTVNQLSAASIRINNVSAGNGMIVRNTGISGCGIYIQQMNTNPNSVGLYVYSNSPAPGIVVDGKISATQYFVQNGLSTQFLKANGTVDSTQYLPLSGGTLTGNLIGSNSAQVKFSKDIVPTTAVGNNNYLNSPIVSQTISNGNYSNVAGIGFHNNGINASMLYYDPNSNNFMHNNNNGGIYTLWDSRNFVPGNYLPLSGGTLTGQLNGTNLRMAGDISAAGNIVKNGGTSTQFLKADGSVDSNPYSYKFSTCAFVSAIGGDVPLSIVSATIPAQTLNTRTVKVSFNYDILNTGSHTSYIQVIFGGDTTTLPTGNNGNCNGKVELQFTASTTGSNGKVSRAASNFGYHGVGVFTAILNNYGGEMSTVNLDQNQGLQVKMLDNASSSSMRVHQVLIEII